MKRFVHIFAWMLLASALPAAAQQLGSARIDSPRLSELRLDHDVLVGDQRMEFILLGVLHGTGLRGGLAEIATCSDLPRGHLQIKQGSTIQQAMDALVAANPGYRWELKDGAVNLLPRGGAPLLRTRIARFQMNATDREIPAVLQELLKLAEVRNSGAALGLKQQAIGQVDSAGPGDTHSVPKQPVLVRIDLQNLSLQEAFNKVVGFSPDGVWVYRETDCKGVKTFVVEMISGR